MKKQGYQIIVGEVNNECGHVTSSSHVSDRAAIRNAYVCDNCGQIALAANRGADCPCGGTYSMDHTDICKQ